VLHPSVCPSLCVYSLLEIRKSKKFKFRRDMTLDKSNWESKFKVKKRSKVKVTGNEHVKIVLRAYVCDKWINLSILPGTLIVLRISGVIASNLLET